MTNFVTYLLYPILLASTLALYLGALTFQWNLATVFAWMAGVRLVLLLVVEYLYPAKLEWKMSWTSFKRDLKK